MKSESRAGSNQTSSQFANEKKQTLGKNDKSIAASIDEPIRDIVNHINENENYFTTSSCSGRIIITGSRKTHLNEIESENVGDTVIKYNQKKNLKWLYNSHTIIDDKNIPEIIENIRLNCDEYETLTLKFEPAILHVRCNGTNELFYGRRLVNIAIASGYRNTGMIVSQSHHCTVAIRSTASLEVPLVDGGQLLVNDHYIRSLIIISNRKMRTNFELLQRLQNNLKQL